jgi:hypothetical protein
MKKLALLLYISFNLHNYAIAASDKSKDAIKKCPAPEICDILYSSVEKCEKGDQKKCLEFVDNYKKSLPKYDCQQNKYNVPAIHICSGWDRYLDILSKLNLKKAKRLYGSEALRNTLDGSTAEEHLKKSKMVGKLIH